MKFMLSSIKSINRNYKRVPQRSINMYLYAMAVYFAVTAACYAGENPIGKIKTGIQHVIGLIMGISFVAGIIICMYGAKKKIDGEPGAYYSIVGGALLAMAPLIMGALYYAFDMGDFATTDATW